MLVWHVGTFINQIEFSSRCCFRVSTQPSPFLFRFAQASFKLGTLWDGKTGPEKEEWLNILRVKHEVEIDEYCSYLYIHGAMLIITIVMVKKIDNEDNVNMIRE